MTDNKTQEMTTREMTVEDEPASTDTTLRAYTFTAEQKHAKYGLRPGALYRGQRNSQGRTIGRPVLVHDPAYGPMQPTLRGMIPFSKLPKWNAYGRVQVEGVSDTTTIIGHVPDTDPARQSAAKAVHAIDLGLVALAIAVVAVLVPTIA